MLRKNLVHCKKTCVYYILSILINSLDKLDVQYFLKKKNFVQYLSLSLFFFSPYYYSKIILLLFPIFKELV